MGPVKESEFTEAGWLLQKYGYTASFLPSMIVMFAAGNIIAEVEFWRLPLSAPLADLFAGMLVHWYAGMQKSP